MTPEHIAAIAARNEARETGYYYFSKADVLALLFEVKRLTASLAEAEKLLKDTIRLTAAKQPTSSNSVYGYGIDEYEDD